MNDYGFSIILGYPFPSEFLNWFKSLQQINGVFWTKTENLHSTIVNCTFPRGRSVKFEKSVLLFKEVLKNKFSESVVNILSGFSTFNISFKEVQLASSNIILPSEDDDRIGQLKRVFQGDMDFISEEKAADMLILPEVIGRDKFSGDKLRLQPSASVTLGKLPKDFKGLSKIDFRKLTKVPPAPDISITGLHVVFYRDRNLNSAVVSNTLEFGTSHKSANIKEINNFFTKL